MSIKIKSHLVKEILNEKVSQISGVYEEVEETARKRIKNKKGILQTNSLENAIITEKATCLIQAAKDLNFIKSHDISSVEWFENNYEARKAAKEILNLYLEDVPSEYYNRNDEPIMVIFGSEKYVLPAKSSFHLCDIKSLENLKGKKYDLIVLDPPWENKSVRRKKSQILIKVHNKRWEGVRQTFCILSGSVYEEKMASESI
ncbi:methyltransferase-like protein 4 [Trichonephila clavata]|uniref:Methyltransferase-like protein 4 n=1 Tax=Trichonephila clavata TaxID=2740835 RepID=A0A8X6H2J0_TRICU|nr:methyltransferase-like protein 4 [Trichonephila clavata]